MGLWDSPGRGTGAWAFGLYRDNGARDSGASTQGLRTLGLHGTPGLWTFGAWDTGTWEQWNVGLGLWTLGHTCYKL